MHRYDDVELADPLRTAERTAEQEVDRPTQHALANRDAGPLGAHRMAALQRAAGNAGVTGFVEDQAGDSVRSVLSSGGGQPLEKDTRAEMEAGLGADFSSVRVHTDGAASESTEAVSANAYTVGDDIVFRHGQYDPSSDTGKRTIAHELTHVVQQRQGPVDGTPTGDGIKVSDPGDRFEQEAEASADAVMSRQSAEPTTATSAATGVQREATGSTEQPDEATRTQMQRDAAGQLAEEEEPEEAPTAMAMQREAMEEEEEDLDIG